MSTNKDITLLGNELLDGGPSETEETSQESVSLTQNNANSPQNNEKTQFQHKSDTNEPMNSAPDDDNQDTIKSPESDENQPVPDITLKIAQLTQTEEDEYEYYDDDDKDNEKSNSANSSIRPPNEPHAFTGRRHTRNDGNTLKERAMNREPLEGLTDDQYDALLEELVEDRKIGATSHNFATSDTINLAIEHVSKEQLHQQKYAFQQQMYSEYKQQVDVFNEELHAFDDESTQLRNELLAKQDEKRERIDFNHHIEHEKHAEHWNSRGVLRQYNTASNELIILRKQFKLLIVQCRFKEAQDVKSILNRREAHEKTEAGNLMQHDYEESLAKMETRQFNERDFFESNCLVQQKSLDQKRARLRIALMNKMKKLQQRGEVITDMEKLWNLYQNERIEEQSRELGTKKPRNIGSKLAKTEINENEGTTITLPPLNIKKRIMKSRAPTSKTAR